MHDPKLIEAMARAMCKARGTGQCAALCLSHSSNFTSGGACQEAPRLYDTAAALTALCTLRPDVAAVLRGEAVVVPREATESMALAALDRSPEPHQPASPVWQLYADIYRAMTAASPYAKETRDAR